MRYNGRMSLPNQVIDQLINAAGGALVDGNLVRINGNRTCAKADASSAATLQGFCGAVASSGSIAVGGPASVVFAGVTRVRCETGLTPVAGQTLWVSATTPGVATNVQPAIAFEVGIIRDATGYSTSNPYVSAEVATVTSAALSGGAQLIFANIAALAAYNPSSIATGTAAYVVTVSDIWDLDKSSSATVDGITIVAAAPGGRWIRRAIANPTAALQTAWWIDGTNGNDENSGVALGLPLKTHGELQRRLGRQVIKQAVTVTILTSLAANDPIVVDYSTAQSAVVTYLGTETVVYGPSTFTSLTAKNSATNTPLQVTDTAIPTSWTASSLVGKCIRHLSGGVPDSRAWVAKDLTAKAARISQATSNALTATGSATVTQVNSWSNGDAFDVVDQVTVPDLIVNGQSALAFGAVKFSTSPRQFQTQNGFAVRFNACSFPQVLGTSFGQSGTLIFANCGFSASQNFLGKSLVRLDACLLGGGSITVTGGLYQLRNDNMFQGSQLLVSALAASSSATHDIAFFDITGSGCVVIADAVFTFTLLWGSGNSAVIINADRNSQVVLSSVPVVTTSGEYISFTAYTTAVLALRDLPFMDSMNNVLISVPQYGTNTGLVPKADTIVVNKTGGGSSLVLGAIVRSNGTAGQAVVAQADTAAHAKGVLGVLAGRVPDNGPGFATGAGPQWVIFDALPTAGNIAYLSTANGGQAQDTIPAAAATNQKLRLGSIIDTRTYAGVPQGLVDLRMEILPVAADGNP